MADEFFSTVERACSDPGSILPRDPGEGLTYWQARAVVEAIGRERAVYVLAIGHALDSVDAENVQRAVVQALKERA